MFGNIGGIETLCREIGKYSEHRNVFCFSETGGIIAGQMKQNGNKVYVLKRRSLTSYLQYPSLVEQICQKEEADLVVVHHENPWIWLAALKVRCSLKIPLIVYVHCEYKDAVQSRKHLGWVKEKLYQRLLKSADRIVVISKFVGHSVEAAVPSVRKKISLVYNGISLENFCVPLTQKRHEAGYTELIFVGRLIPEKGVDILLDAFTILCRIRNDLHLTIVGYGPEEEKLQEKAKDSQIEDKVTFTGRQTDVTPFLKKADIFIHPAVWNEGFGLTIVEAMCAGVIPVAVGHGSIPEIIEDGQNGFLVDEAEAAKLADGIRRALKVADTPEGYRIRKNAVDTAKKFSVQRTAVRLDHIFLKTWENGRTK